MSVINNNNNVPIYDRFRLSMYNKLFSMASDDVYLHGQGGANLFVVSGSYTY